MSYDKMVDSAQLDADLLAIANKIREAGGTSASLNFPNDYISAIDELGRADLTIPKDVDLIDYDGRLLYSYTKDEFLALSTLPANPVNKGLIAQGWNWTLADAQEFVEEYGALVIGQNYTTNDGKTRVYVNIPNDYVQVGRAFSINANLASGTTCIVNWGDGNMSSMSGSNSNKSVNHVYEQAGNYIIELEVTVGSLKLGYSGSNNTLTNSNMAEKLRVVKVEIGEGVTGLCRNTFFEMHNLKSVSIPITCINHDKGQDYSMFSGVNLTGIVFPTGTPGQDTKIVGNSANDILHLKYIAIPKSMNGFRINGNQTKSLRKLIFPSYTTSTTLQTFLYDTNSLTHFIVPGTYTTIPADRCRSSFIKSLIIPTTVTSISATAFIYNGSCREVHLQPTTPPTLSNTNAFGSIGSNCIFYVPYSADHSILEAYQSATNWSTYASQMQEEPQS